MGAPMMRAGMTPPNKGKRYPAEVLTAAEVAAVIGRCSPKAATGIRNRALLTLLYRSGPARQRGPGAARQRRQPGRAHRARAARQGRQGDHPRVPPAARPTPWPAGSMPAASSAAAARCSAPCGAARCSDQYVRNLLHRLGERAGIDKRVHPHGLRHTFAVELEAAGTPVTVIIASYSATPASP